jgi:hypothetical protein
MKDADKWIKLDKQLSIIYKQKEHVLHILINSLGKDHELYNYEYFKHDNLISILHRILKRFYPYNTKYIYYNNVIYDINVLLYPGNSVITEYVTTHDYGTSPQMVLYLDDRLYIENYVMYFKGLLNDLLFECTVFKSLTDYDIYNKEILIILNNLTDFLSKCQSIPVKQCNVSEELSKIVIRDVIRFDSSWI